MSSVSVNLTTTNQVYEFIKFCYKTNTPFTLGPEDKELFSYLLYQLIDAGQLPAAWMKSPDRFHLVQWLRDELVARREGDDTTEDIVEQIDSIESFIEQIDDGYRFEHLSKLRKPTKEFKEICGSEWLTPKGLISKSAAITFFLARESEGDDKKVVLTDWGKLVLDVQKPIVYKDDLPRLIDHWFER
jgi:hypothetical protein